jgi:aspartate racemase
VRPALTLGVLGGLGPAATVDFLQRLQADTPAAVEHDHIRVLADINPKLAGPEAANAGFLLAEAAGALSGAGADVLAIVNDAAHAHAELIERASGLAIIDMIDAATQAAQATGARRVGVLGPRAAVKLYREYVAAHAMGMVSLENDHVQAFAATLQAVRDGDVGRERRAELRAFAAELLAGGAEVVIAGAVELPLILEQADLPAPLIVPAETLSRRCVAVCLGLEPAPFPPAV